MMEQIKNLDSISHGREERVSIGRKDDVGALRGGREDSGPGGCGGAVRGAAQAMEFVIEFHVVLGFLFHGMIVRVLNKSFGKLCRR